MLYWPSFPPAWWLLSEEEAGGEENGATAPASQATGHDVIVGRAADGDGQ